MAADVGFCVSKVVQANFTGGSFESFVDVVCRDVTPCLVQRMVVFKDASSGSAAMGQDVVHTACKRFHRTVGGARALMVYALSLHAVLLVWHANGSFHSSEEFG